MVIGGSSNRLSIYRSTFAFFGLLVGTGDDCLPLFRPSVVAVAVWNNANNNDGAKFPILW